MFDKLARDTIQDVVKGFNGTIFAYGQVIYSRIFVQDRRLDPEKHIQCLGARRTLSRLLEGLSGCSASESNESKFMTEDRGLIPRSIEFVALLNARP